VSSVIGEHEQFATLVERTLERALAGRPPVIVGIGVDVVDLDAFERQLRVGGQRFLERLLLPAEIAHCGERIEQLATRVAGKEAVVKALGCGFRGVSWREVEIATAANGAPSVVLHGRASTHARQCGADHVHVSFAHEARSAVAIAIAQKTNAERPGEAGGESDE
jgi:holo-[acyl-carrier protein] synthase